MKVFKFGGASVKDASAVKNVSNIISSFGNEQLVVVVSAMGKTTNALEEIWKAFLKEGKDSLEALRLLEKLKLEHLDIASELFEGNLPDSILEEFAHLRSFIASRKVLNEQFIYDQIVSKGEMISTKIVSEYLNRNELLNNWLDVRDCIFTNRNFREGIVDWDRTEKQLSAAYKNCEKDIVITQGFLGGTAEGMTTTLGREGSDYSAAIFAYCLNAEDLTIWKDVPGVLSADPRKFTRAQLINKLSYQQAMQMTYHGAKVIHHKTIKPLFEKAIPLIVRSFSDLEKPGTVICPKSKGTGRKNGNSEMPPFIVHLNGLAMLRITRKNALPFSENDLASIYVAMGNTYNHAHFSLREADAFLLLVDYQEFRIQSLSQVLEEHFVIQVIERDCDLLTVHDQDIVLPDFLASKRQWMNLKTGKLEQTVFY